MYAQSKVIRLDEGFNVWTRRVGEGPVHMLLLHGGPGFNHEYFENFADFLPDAGITIHFYDQLGSFYSDQPDDPSLWNIERFRAEVEQVRQALGLDQFYLLGHSWGGLLSIEYALEFQKHIKGMVISNMTASIPSYVRYLGELREQMPADSVARMMHFEAAGDYEAPEYQELLQELYNRHVCRAQPWPDAVQRAFAHVNAQVYNTMQGDNEFVVTGTFKDWDRWDDLHRIEVPTLLTVGRQDTMSVADIEEMGRRIPDAGVDVVEDAGHLAMWDNPEGYFRGILDFVKEIEGRG